MYLTRGGSLLNETSSIISYGSSTRAAEKILAFDPDVSRIKKLFYKVSVSRKRARAQTQNAHSLSAPMKKPGSQNHVKIL